MRHHDAFPKLRSVDTLEVRPPQATMKLPALVFLFLSLVSGQVLRHDPPALKDSGMAYFASDAKGSVYLSWIDPLPAGGHALRYARWTGTAWSAPSTITSGRGWFVNWADFPALAITQDGTMLAHWLTKTEGSGTYGYGIRVARKASGETAWKQIFGANLNDKVDYAGFLSFAVTGNTAGAVYLAPPPDAERTVAHNHDAHDSGEEMEHRKTLRYVSFQASGAVVSDRELDADTCSCCQTTVVSTPTGLLAAYRDHAPGEIRDIAIVRLVNGRWTAPQTFHADGWKINGCPTEGPSAAVQGERVGIAWLTRAQDKPRIQMTLSANSGATFGKPLRIDDGDPYGHPNVTMFDDQHSLVAWIEKVPNGAELRMRRVSINGVMSPSVVISNVAAARSAGLPKIVVSGNQILLAWRDDRVRAGVLSKSQFISMEKRK
jgi:hypothetical protein